jgi:DNA primase large subunit
MDVLDFALFPFVNGALNYVKALDFKLDELFFDRAFEQIRERGKQRVIESIGEGISRPDINESTGAQKELLSYPVARILVSCINDGYLIKRYALAEAKSSSKHIQKISDKHLKELIDDLTIAANINEREYTIHFTDYIRYASSIHDPKWKLINSKVNHGIVHLKKEDLVRLIEEAVRKRIESGLPLEVPQEICTALEVYLNEIKDRLSARKSQFSIEEFKEIMPDCFPPCIKRALSDAQAGVNLPHSMRFALTSFLLNIGMNVEGIIELLKVSPDFDEERTRYQVMHIHGSSGTVYKPPSCSTMVTYGNCYGKEALCERISHPLGYYRKKAWILKKER